MIQKIPKHTKHYYEKCLVNQPPNPNGNYMGDSLINVQTHRTQVERGPTQESTNEEKVDGATDINPTNPYLPLKWNRINEQDTSLHRARRSTNILKTKQNMHTRHTYLTCGHLMEQRPALSCPNCVVHVQP